MTLEFIAMRDEDGDYKVDFLGNKFFITFRSFDEVEENLINHVKKTFPNEKTFYIKYLASVDNWE